MRANMKFTLYYILNIWVSVDVPKKLDTRSYLVTILMGPYSALATPLMGPYLKNVSIRMS